MKIDTYKLKIEKSSGFTLIEIMIVIAIIGILSSIALVNSGRNPDRDVNQDKERLITFLRDAQNKALSAEQVSGAMGKVCGFGVTFPSDTSAQIFYVQTTGSNYLNTDCGSALKTFTSNADFSSQSFPDSSNPETFALAKNVTFVGTPGDIYFQIPNGEVYYNGTRIDSGQNISLMEDPATGNITIQSSGLIQ